MVSIHVPSSNGLPENGQGSTPIHPDSSISLSLRTAITDELLPTLASTILTISRKLAEQETQNGDQTTVEAHANQIILELFNFLLQGELLGDMPLELLQIDQLRYDAACEWFGVEPIGRRSNL